MREMISPCRRESGELPSIHGLRWRRRLVCSTLYVVLRWWCLPSIDHCRKGARRGSSRDTSRSERRPTGDRTPATPRMSNEARSRSRVVRSAWKDSGGGERTIDRIHVRYENRMQPDIRRSIASRGEQSPRGGCDRRDLIEASVQRSSSGRNTWRRDRLYSWCASFDRSTTRASKRC